MWLTDRGIPYYMSRVKEGACDYTRSWKANCFTAPPDISPDRTPVIPCRNGLKPPSVIGAR